LWLWVLPRNCLCCGPVVSCYGSSWLAWCMCLVVMSGLCVWWYVVGVFDVCLRFVRLFRLCVVVGSVLCVCVLVIDVVGRLGCTFGGFF